MKKIVLLALLSFGFMNAQVGIGTTTPLSSSNLDVTATDKGVLIPRVALIQTTSSSPVTTPANSLLIYNTASVNDVTPGFYYWSSVSSSWVKLLDNDGWDIDGNSNITASNFMGTINNADVVFKSFNAERMRLTSTGNFGIGDSSPASLFTVGSGDLFQVASTGHVRTINGAIATPAYSFTGDTNTGMFHSALADDFGLSTGGVQRLWLSDAGEVYVGATAPILPGDLFCATASNTNATTSGSGNLTWAINGYSAYNGGSIYGLRLNGGSGVWGSGQFEIQSGMTVATAKGVYGSCGVNTQYGVNGFKPSGGTGWGGLFQNDLGYTGFFGAASDRSLKKNIKPFGGALAIIDQLPVYTFQYKTEKYDVLGDDSLHYGVMADELKQLVPDLVKSKTLAAGPIRSLPEDKQPRGVEGEVNLVNYVELSSITLQALKELQDIVKQQQLTISKLEKEIELLKKK